MTLVPMAALSRCMPRLPPLRLRRLMREMGKEGAEAVSPGEALLLWLAHWMAATQPVPPDQQDLLLVELGKEIIAYGDAFEAKMKEAKEGETVPAAVVSILDRSFAIISGREAFLVLTKGEYVKGLSRPPVESLSYNLAGMYAMAMSAVASKSLNPDARRGTITGEAG